MSRNQAGFPVIAARALCERLAAPGELALIDVREQGTHSRGHPLLAVSLPFSHLETRLAGCVPRRTVPAVLLDERNEGLAARAAKRLADWGYTDISILEGGLQGWREAGLEVFSGVHVPSKAFGEFVEHAYHTPSIDVGRYQAWQAEGRPMVVLDSRPFEEFNQYSLPGGIDCPGAELVSRVFDLVPDPRTLIVVNCAGRTRSIIGAQSLINAGIPNPVFALENGTAGWVLAGQTMVRGNRSVAPPPGLRGLEQAIEASRRVARRFGVTEIDATGLAAMRAQAGARTLYLLDVRTPEEYQAGHLPGSRNAPGGQLVQSIDQYVAVRGARMVLVDDHGVRARMTASWLLQMGGYDVSVLVDGLAAPGQALERGPQAPRLPGQLQSLPVAPVTVLELARWLEEDRAVLVDLDTSLRYRAGHIPGAWWAIRSRLGESLGRVPQRQMLVLTSSDGAYAAICAADAAAATTMPVYLLAGGTQAWAAAGLALADGFEHLADETDDVWYSPYEHDDLRRALANYLSWEVGLVEQLARPGGLAFRRFDKD
jgi:rhodanese-related sulfurtransferase